MFVITLKYFDRKIERRKLESHKNNPFHSDTHTHNATHKQRNVNSFIAFHFAINESNFYSEIPIR